MSLNTKLKNSKQALQNGQRYLQRGVQLRSDVSIFCVEDQLCLILPNCTRIQIKNGARYWREYGQEMINGIRPEQLRNRLCNQDFIPIFKQLDSLNALIQMPPTELKSDYAIWGLHQADHILDVDGLDQMSILFLGCGNLGSMIAAQLSNLSLKKAILLDDSVVTGLEQNGMFKPGHKGQKKVDILPQLLGHTSTEFIGISKTFSSGSDLSKIEGFDEIDLIVHTIDRPKLDPFSEALKIAISQEIPILTLSVDLDDLVLGPLSYRSETYQRYLDSVAPLVRENGGIFLDEQSPKPSCIFMNSIFSGVAARQIHNFLILGTCSNLEKTQTFDGQTMSIQTIQDWAES